MATFHFDLVSPEQLLFSGEVDQVDVPGSEGEFGVLANHAPLVATLKPGILTIHESGKALRVVVFGGLPGVSPEGPTVLADKTVPAEEIDVATIAAEVKDVEEDLVDTTDETVRDNCRRKLEQLRAVQAAVTGATTAAH